MSRPFELLTRERLGDRLYRYLIGRPADLDGDVVDANETAYQRYRLVPRVMRGQGDINIRTALLGKCFSGPIAVGAFAGDRLFHPCGLIVVARVCQRLGLPMIVSEETVTPLSDLTAAHDGCWLQIRAAGPVDRARSLLDLAVRWRAQAVVLGVLAPASPLPALQPGGYNVGEELARRGWSTIGSNSPGIERLSALPHWSWKEVRAVVSHGAAVDMPILIKGILHGEDARLAEDAGCCGIIVSNIGLRQLGRWAIPLDQVTMIRNNACGPVLVDGGFRRGVDGVIARCLGADMAIATRPVVSALVGGGEAGVYNLLRGWLDELTNIVSWMGVAELGELGADHIRGEAGTASLHP